MSPVLHAPAPPWPYLCRGAWWQAVQNLLAITCGARAFVGVDTSAIVKKHFMWMIPPAVLADGWEKLRRTLPHREATINRQASLCACVRKCDHTQHLLSMLCTGECLTRPGRASM